MTDQYIATWQTGDEAGPSRGARAGGRRIQRGAGGQAGDEEARGPETPRLGHTRQRGPEVRPDQAGERGPEAGGYNEGPEAGGYNEGPEAGGYNEGSEAPRRLGPPMSTREVTG